MSRTAKYLHGLASKRDVKTHDALRESICSGRCVAFVGAGMSARAGFTDWSGLLEELEESAGGNIQRRNRENGNVLVTDMSWRAEELRTLIKKDTSYFQILSRHFDKAGKRDKALDAFAKLAFRHFFTTNYDRSLEAALLVRETGRGRSAER